MDEMGVEIGDQEKATGVRPACPHRHPAQSSLCTAKPEMVYKTA